VNPRLFRSVFSLEARKLMSYRADFWINAVIGFVAQYGVMFFLWQALYRESGQSTIRGWTFPMMILYYVLAILVGKLVRGSDHLGDIAQDIYDGGLTRYIIYPTGYFSFKYAQHLGNVVPAMVQLVLFTGLYLVLLPIPQEADISAASVLMAVPAIVLGNLLFYTLMAPLQMVAFWADNVWSLSVLFRFTSGLLGGAMLPLTLFPDWGQRILAWLPFRQLFSEPILILLGQLTPGQWLRSLGVTVFWIGALQLVQFRLWQRGKKVYTGVGI
jgi:ABC-2 type transport system permease protein